jgi:hypothetical protein
MLYLIEGEVYEGLHALPPDQVVAAFEGAILPSLEILAQWEESGQLWGGAVAGHRQGTFILDAPSHEELGNRLRSLPFWGLIRWHTTPLQPFRSALEGDKRVIEQLKAAVRP